MFTYPVELTILLIVLTSVRMDLSHQVNTIATINLFCMSNITCINFGIIYCLANKHVLFSMAIEDVELMHKCSPEHLCMGTAKLKCGKETEEEDNQKIIKMRSTSNTKKISPNGLTIARASRSPESLLHEAVDELPNEPTYTDNTSNTSLEMGLHELNLSKLKLNTDVFAIKNLRFNCQFNNVYITSISLIFLKRSEQMNKLRFQHTIVIIK